MSTFTNTFSKSLFQQGSNLNQIPAILKEASVFYDFKQGANATVLYDKSINARNGTLGTAAAKPEWLKRGLSFFQEGNTLVSVPQSALVSGNNPLTIMVMGKRNQGGLAYGLLFSYNAGGLAYQEPAIYFNTAAIATPQLRRGGGGNLTMTKTVDIERHGIWYEYNPTGTLLTGQVDNDLASIQSLNIGANLAANATNPARIGYQMTGSAYALAIWNKLLTADEKAIAYNYVKDFGKDNNLVVFDGNSLTFGTPNGNTESYPHQMMYAVRSGWDWYNFGVAGQTTTQMSTDFDAQILPLFNATRSKQFLCAWEIGNQLIAIGATQAHTNFKAYCDHARAVLPAGTKIIVANIPPRITSGFNTARATVNALIAANWATYADALVDLASDATIGQDSSTSNATYYQADQIHMTAAGYAIVAGLFKTAFDALNA